MDIVDILKDLMSPRSNSDLTTPTACNVGGSGGFGRNVSGSGKGTRTGVRLPDSFDYEEDSTIVHLLPTETESTEEYYDDDDSNLFHDVNMDDEDESTIIQHLPGSDHNNTYNDHHQLLQHDDIEKVVPRHHSTSPQPRHHSPSPPPTTYQLQHPAVGTSITNLLHQQHQHQHPIPSLLSSSEDETEEEEDIDEMEEEDSTIVQPLPGQDDSTAVAAAVTAATAAAALQQQQMQRGSISFNSSCNSSRSLPLQEVFMKNKKKTDSYNDNNTEVGGGVEIVDVIMEHFDFSPEWEDVGAVGASGFGSCGGGDAVVGEKKVVVDDDSTVVQHLPGEEDTYNDDDNISDIVFADRRMRHSKNGQKGAGQSTSLTKKATTAAAVFVTLTVCLGVGYKAGNIMTLGGSNTSSSSSVAVLTPDDCLALRNVTATHENNSSGKQRLRRRIEESSWQRVSSLHASFLTICLKNNPRWCLTHLSL